MSFRNGAVTVGNTATPVCIVGVHGATIQNQGTQHVWVGASTVAISGSANAGIWLPGNSSGATVLIPGCATEAKIGGGLLDSGQLYAVAAVTGAGPVAYICESTIGS